MFKIYLVFSVLFAGVLSDGSGFKAFKFQQQGNKIKVERFELIRYDKNYFKYASATSFKYNRTCVALNLTFLFAIEVGNELQIVVQMYKFLSNEYRHFPVRFQISACDALKENAFGLGDLITHGNFTGCPIKKNILYKVWNWSVDESKFPPLIPEGRYLVELQAFFHDKDLGLFHAYVEIVTMRYLPRF